MRTSFQGGSAKIYEFPARGRFAVSAHRDEQSPLASARVAVASGSSWYHDEAIQEAERARKN